MRNKSKINSSATPTLSENNPKIEINIDNVHNSCVNEEAENEEDDEYYEEEPEDEFDDTISPMTKY